MRGSCRTSGAWCPWRWCTRLRTTVRHRHRSLMRTRANVGSCTPARTVPRSWERARTKHPKRRAATPMSSDSAYTRRARTPEVAPIESSETPFALRRLLLLEDRAFVTRRADHENVCIGQEIASNERLIGPVKAAVSPRRAPLIDPTDSAVRSEADEVHHVTTEEVSWIGRGDQPLSGVVLESLVDARADGDRGPTADGLLDVGHALRSRRVDARVA